MNTEKYIVLIALILMGIVIVFCLFVFLKTKINDYVYKKRYPRWIDFLKKYDNMTWEKSNFHNKNIVPLYEKIDNLEYSKKYLPITQKNRVEKELENLKRELYLLQEKERQMQNDMLIFWNTVGFEISQEENVKTYNKK